MEKTLTGLFTDYIEKINPDKKIFFTKEDVQYIPYTSSELVRDIYSVIKFFQSIGLKENDSVAIISENRTEWVAVDFACMFMKLVSIPVYTSLAVSQIEYILKNSDAKVCFVSNTLLLEKVVSVQSRLTDLKKIIIFNNVFNKVDFTKFSSEFITSFKDLIIDHELSHSELIEKLKEFSGQINPSDLVTIIYTSGTTGIPKGVMLSHRNIHSNVLSCQKVLTINDKDVFLSFLPYSHAYERTTGYYLAFFCGAVIYYAQNIDTIARQLPETQPTIVITVPRLLDKIYNKLMKSGDDMDDGFKKKIFLWAIEFAKQPDINKKSVKWKIADKLVYKKIREKTGSRIRFFASGGGALNKTVGMFFDNIGIMILEGYGMTEASPVISVNHPDKNKYGTVGKPVEGVSVKLSHENEILISGELVMEGYYKDEASTKDMIRDNWLHTGDVGEIDPDGYVRITDRKKSLIKTSGGKYVAPTQIEDLLSRLPYIENVMVIGNERMYVTAVLVPEKNELQSFAKKNNVPFDSYTGLISNKQLYKLISKDIDALQKDLASHESVRKFVLLEEPFSIDSGELTPTMKVKRKFVEEKFKDKIESMYLKI
ncbi:MAG: long-chain fatty acid--CoA ligase [bacterium]|nr:long-chain fatty acid--CoA ligase [bacterium]